MEILILYTFIRCKQTCRNPLRSRRRKYIYIYIYKYLYSSHKIIFFVFFVIFLLSSPIWMMNDYAFFILVHSVVRFDNCINSQSCCCICSITLSATDTFAFRRILELCPYGPASFSFAPSPPPPRSCLPPASSFFIFYEIAMIRDWMVFIAKQLNGPSHSVGYDGTCRFP